MIAVRLGIPNRAARSAAPAPTLVSISPAFGSTLGGSITYTVTFTGALTALKFGSTAVLNLTAATSTTATFNAPALAAGAYDVTAYNGVLASNVLTSGYRAIAISAWVVPDGTGITQPVDGDGLAISAAADWSGSSHGYSQASGTNQPTRLDNALNGHRAIRFSKTSSTYLSGSAASSLFSNSSNARILVFRVNSIVTDSATFAANDHIDGSFSNYYGTYVRARNSGEVASINYHGAYVVSLTAPINDGLFHRVVSRHGSGVVGVQLDAGAEVTTASGNTDSLVEVHRFGNAGGAGANFDLVEAVILTAYDATDIAAINASIAAKYPTLGLSS